MFPMPRQITRLVVLLSLLCSVAAFAQEDEPTPPPTPPRLSLVDGPVSYWRPGAEDWVAARLNTPLAVGDALYAGDGANLELQIGSRAFVRAVGTAQLTLVDDEPDYLQFQLVTGVAAFDLRALPPGYSVEVDTPNAAFTLAHAGYYRVTVNDDTHFITRRGGRATVSSAGSDARSILPAEEIVVQDGEAATVEAYMAPELDAWDRWNYARTDYLLEAVSARYLPAGVYGAEELDRYGGWREVPDYGPVWIPDEVPAGWAPYSAGSWMWDPYYTWTWVDDAPWGWAPCHYGRWVFLNGFWAWAPGPVVVRPRYAPAVVGFLGVGPSVSGEIGSGIGWVALGWGEPLLPWWGRPGFIGRPSWQGWGGPRLVNNVVIQRTTVVNVTNITFQNTQVHNAVVVMPNERFGREHVRATPVAITRVHDLLPFRGSLPVKPVPASLVAGARGGIRPPPALLSRPVVGTRPAREPHLPWRADTSQRQAAVKATAEIHLVPAPTRPEVVLPRPKFGAENGPERPRPSLPPRFEEMTPPAATPTSAGEHREKGSPNMTESASPPSAPKALRTPRVTAPEALPPSPIRAVQAMPPREIRESPGEKAAPPTRAFAPEARSRAPSAREHRALPGKPANRLFRGHGTDETEKGNKENIH